ncbi:NACHT domain-containing protein [Saccharothrix sp. Mg75]|uniref:NACHT domain-containing protein n=1 Tax=Saccharothrix sp. Mg75 TaxID=3445357 RepID=UPI003EE877B9
MPRPDLFSYEGALRVLGRHERPWLDRADVFLGLGILVGGAAEPDVLSLVDPKNEATASVRKVLDGITDRLTGLTGVRRQELVAAAHTIIAVTSVFDAFRDEVGPRLDLLDVTDREKFRSLGAEPGGKKEVTALPALTSLEVPAPDATRGFTENLEGGLGRFLAAATDLVADFLAGLDAWASLSAGRDGGELRRAVANGSRERYTHHYLGLAAAIPEFRIWAFLGEHGATRTALTAGNARLGEELAGFRAESLERFSHLLSLTAPGPLDPARSCRAKLEAAAGAALGKPLLRGDTGTSSLAVSFPTVERGFVTPAYRLVVHHEDTVPSSEEWWAEHTTAREDLDAFLAAHLAGPESTTRPLLVLGHPGAGKSLLMAVLAARLPARGFTVVTVPLRKVRAEEAVHKQIETALSDQLAERVEWGRLADECADSIRVVLLDGFDELVQASGVVQSRYVELVREFQEQQADTGRPVAVVITSRPLVMGSDRAGVPHGTPIVKLEEFDDARVDRWLGAWHEANAATPGLRRLEPAQLLRHGGFARQPLILLMLVLYAADPENPPLDEDLSQAQLYERLITSFVRRQARDKGPVQPPEDHVAAKAEQSRWQLSVAALAMFNRGHQYVSDEDLAHDLGVFAPADPVERTGFDTPLTAADRVVEDFFFIHSARMNDGAGAEAGAGRRTYEFLHATFGEYLIAEVTLNLLVDAVAVRSRAPSRTSRPVRKRVTEEEDLLLAFLSHQVLVKRKPVLDFTVGLFARLEPEVRDDILELLNNLTKGAHEQAERGSYPDYSPSGATLVSRVATYSANLICLRVFLTGGPVPLEEDLAEWRATVRLWQAGVDPEGWQALRKSLRLDLRDGVHHLVRRAASVHASPYIEEAQLLGDGLLEGTNRLGDFIGPDTTAHADEQELLSQLAEWLMLTSGMGGARHVLPYDLGLLEEVVNALDTGTHLNSGSWDAFIRSVSREAWRLPNSLVVRVVGHAVAQRQDLFEIISALCAHPHLLDDRQLLVKIIGQLDDAPDDALPSLITARLARTRVGRDHLGLDHLIRALEQVARHNAAIGVNHGYASPMMIDYLVDPATSAWAFDGPLLSSMFRLPGSFWRQIAPVQFFKLFERFRWADVGTRSPEDRLMKFAAHYLEAQGKNCPPDLPSATEVLRELALESRPAG